MARLPEGIYPVKLLSKDSGNIWVCQPYNAKNLVISKNTPVFPMWTDKTNDKDVITDRPSKQLQKVQLR